MVEVRKQFQGRAEGFADGSDVGIEGKRNQA